MIFAYSALFVNKHDKLYEFAGCLKEIEGYETVVCHGSSDSVFLYGNNKEEFEVKADMFAAMLENSTNYQGGDIRLVACSTGAKKDGFAQQLANELQVSIIAPTESVWVNDKGELFVSNNDILAEMWYNGDEKVQETGRWIVFCPERRTNEKFDKIC